MTRTTTHRHAADSNYERGLSNVIWAVIFFGVITFMTIGGAVMGFNALDEASGGDSRAAAQEGMLQVRGDMYDLAGGAPYRTTTVDVQDGALTYGSPIQIELSASTGSESMETQVIEPTPVIYELGDYQYVFVAGAVFLEQDNGRIIKEGPSFRIAEKEAIIPLINTTHHDGPEHVSVGGDGQGYITGHKWDTSSTQFQPTADGDPVEATATMKIETPRYEMWASWFRQQSRFTNVNVDGDANSVSAEFTTNRLYVQTIQTRVRLEV